jgi:recombination protein RecA
MVDATLRRGAWVALVDASRTLAASDWARVGGREAEGLWVIRPTDPARAAWCGDLLLRSGAFGLVVLDSAPTLARKVAVRLTRLAREAGAALVVTGDGEHEASQLAGAVRVEVSHRNGATVTRRRPPQQAHHAHHAQHAPHVQHPRPQLPPPSFRAPRALSIRVVKGGIPQRSVEVRCAIGVARRLCAHPQVPDRRGVARAGASGRGGGERSDGGGDGR